MVRNRSYGWCILSNSVLPFDTNVWKSCHPELIPSLNRLSVGRIGWLYSSARQLSCTPSLQPTSGIVGRTASNAGVLCFLTINRELLNTLDFWKNRMLPSTVMLVFTFVQGQWKHCQRNIPKCLWYKWLDPTCFLVFFVQPSPVRASPPLV